MHLPYTHELQKEIRSISGGYELDKEETLEMDGKTILYAVGNAVVDKSCCGAWGCRYALVAGAVIDWKCRRNDAQDPVSIVEPIHEEPIRAAITERLKEIEGVIQVRFW